MTNCFETVTLLLLLPCACVMKTDFGDTDLGSDTGVSGSDTGEGEGTATSGEGTATSGEETGPEPEVLPAPHVLDWSVELEHGVGVRSDYTGMGIGPGGDIIAATMWWDGDNDVAGGVAHRYTLGGVRELEVGVPMTVVNYFEDACMTPDGRIYASSRHIQISDDQTEAGVVELSTAGDVLEAIPADVHEWGEVLDDVIEIVCDDAGKAWMALNTAAGTHLQAFDGGTIVESLWIEADWTRLDHVDGVLHVAWSEHSLDGSGETHWERRDEDGALLSSVVLPVEMEDVAISGEMGVVLLDDRPGGPIAAFDTAGVELWRYAPTPMADIQDVAIDPQGWSAITWYDQAQSERFFVSLVSPLGTEAWSLELEPVGGPEPVGHTFGMALEFDPQGGIVVVGGTTSHQPGEDSIERAWITRFAAP